MIDLHSIDRFSLDNGWRTLAHVTTNPLNIPYVLLAGGGVHAIGEALLRQLVSIISIYL